MLSSRFSRRWFHPDMAGVSPCAGVFPPCCVSPRCLLWGSEQLELHVLQRGRQPAVTDLLYLPVEVVRLGPAGT